MSMKTKTWQEIAEKIIANSVNKRDSKEVKKMDYKSQTRKMVADRRRELVKTGGASQPIDLTDIEQRSLKRMGQHCIGGTSGTSGTTPRVKTGPPTTVSGSVSETEPVVIWAAATEAKTLSKTFLEGSRQKRDAKMTQATKTNDSKVIVELETEKVQLLKEYVAIQREILDIERRGLEIKEEKLKILKGVQTNPQGPQSPFSLSPIIKLL